MDAACERAREFLLIAVARHAGAISNEWGRTFVRIANAEPNEAVREFISFFRLAASNHWIEQRDLWSAFDAAELSSLDGETPTNATLVIRDIWDKILTSFSDTLHDEGGFFSLDYPEIGMRW